MKIVLTLLVRDEADIVDSCIRYHLERGVDLVLATDHRSVDGTTDILRRYERDGALRLLREDGETLEQAAWVTRMARLAATEHGADWVINCDADEFWWPRRGTIREILAAVPGRYGAVRGLWRHFVLRPDGDGAFHERMTVRRRPSDDFADPYHAGLKVAHRASPDVVVSKGNHDAEGPGLLLLREWFPFEVLHFPIRTAAQLERKYRITAEAELQRDDPRVARHVRATVSRMREEGGDAVHRSLLVDDVRLQSGLADGSLVVDTRLRDALREIEAGHGLPAVVPPSRADDADLVEDVQVALLHDSQVILGQRLEQAERRVAALEHRGGYVSRVLGRSR